jgi:nicotinamidase/pyrazinamidase
LPRDTTIFSKADAERDAYSGFDGTGLAEHLQRHEIRTVFVGGLAAEYCVKQTVLNALRHGFETFVLADATRGISQCDSARAIEERLAEGAQRVTLPGIISSIC